LQISQLPNWKFPSYNVMTTFETSARKLCHFTAASIPDLNPIWIPESFHEASHYELQINEMQILFYGQHSMLEIKPQTSLQNV
jgi:hypothetical protein